MPLTGTSIVKFRQQLRGIPIYGSLISVELDDANEMVSLNSNLASPDVASTVARISPHAALKRVASEAGYGRELPDVTPVLNFYLDARNKWHLAYVVENIRSRKKDKKHGGAHGLPLVYDYIVDALSGALVAELPRTPAMAGTTIPASTSSEPRGPSRSSLPAARRRCAIPRSTSRRSTSASAIRKRWEKACPER